MLTEMSMLVESQIIDLIEALVTLIAVVTPI